jgi:antitoxin HicB
MKNAKHYLQQPYARIVIPDESGGFHAEILEFPGCYAQGDNLEDVYKHLEETAESWIEACLEKGQDIPEPASNVGYSGRLVLRLPRGIHRRAAELAEHDRTSLNTYVIASISAKIGAEDFYNTLAKRFERHIWNAMGAAFHQWSTTSGTGTELLAAKPEKITDTASTASGA